MIRLRNNLSAWLKGLAAISLVLSSLGNVIGVRAAPALQAASSQSPSGPRVVAVTPGSGFLEERNAGVEIAFDLPMDRARTEAAFSIQPELPHAFRWEDAQTLQIQFRKSFAPGTQYSLTLVGGDTENSAQSLDGVPLSEDYRWYYWLAPFEASVTTPHPTQVVLKFNTAIDRAKSGPPFAIEPAVDGEWKWGSDQTVFFTATSPFPPAQLYAIRLTGPLYDQFGEIPSGGLDLAFTSPPPIGSVEPQEGLSVPADFGPIEIVFTEAVDLQSAQNAFSITPAIAGRFAWSQSKPDGFQDTLSFFPETLFDKGKEYTVSLSPELKARAGTPLLLSPYRWTFTVDTYYSSYGAPATFGQWGYNVQVVDVNGPRKVQFEAGDGLISFELYRYDLIDFVKLYSEEARSGSAVPNIRLPAAEEERLVASWNYTEGESTMIDQTVIPPDVPAGLYILNIKHEGRSYGQLFVVLTRNTLTAKLSGDQLFVWVSDI
ncbi:MAG TPA: Ig-like domain-containing protein, partial [Anaerolineales bacterium]